MLTACKKGTGFIWGRRIIVRSRWGGVKVDVYFGYKQMEKIIE